jgi:type I restriction enzyme S subunit
MGFVFPCPPLDLCCDYAEIAEALYEESDVLEQKNANLRQTRDLLLPKLISGELDVSELEIKTEEIGK